MARRRFQDPKPKRRGKWWTLQVRRDEFVGGQLVRKKTRVRIAPAAVSEREPRKIAAEYLRPQNQGLELIGSATNFSEYVENTYKPIIMPLMAKTTQHRSRGVMTNYLVPEFGKLSLRDLTPLRLQRYFSGLAASPLAHESKDKIKDVLSAILGSAVQYGLLVKNPVEGIRLPAERRGKRKTKPHVTPEQFEQLLELISEPYASMVFVAVWTGLRVSELIGLKWEDVGADSLTIDERCCREDWDAPKSEASNATIGVESCVIERINRLKQITVDVKAGLAVRHYKVVKSDRPEDLVFQSVGRAHPCETTTFCRGTSSRPRANSVCPGSTGVACAPRMRPGWSRQAPTQKTCKARCGILASRPPWTSMHSLCRNHSGALSRRCQQWLRPERQSRLHRQVLPVFPCRRNRGW